MTSKFVYRKVEENDVDAVRFMNLHKAKGLEGNIVIWTNRREKETFHDGEYRVGNKVYPAIFKKNRDNNVFAWAGYNRDTALREAAIAADEAEQIRLEYVACTRLESRLMDIISAARFMSRYSTSPLPNRLILRSSAL